MTSVKPSWQPHDPHQLTRGFPCRLDRVLSSASQCVRIKEEGNRITDKRNEMNERL